jgi:hypothetical protein
MIVRSLDTRTQEARINQQTAQPVDVDGARQRSEASNHLTHRPRHRWGKFLGLRLSSGRDLDDVTGLGHRA